MLWRLADKKSDEMASKQYYDSLKHLTTLDTGSILLLGTFLEKLFQNREWQFLIGVTFVSLSASVIACVMAMFMHTFTMDDELSEEGFNVFFAINFVAFNGFVVGVLSFVVFAMKNFY